MSGYHTIVITTPEAGSVLTTECPLDVEAHEQVTNLRNLMERYARGDRNCTMVINTAAVAAVASITFTGAVSNAETMLLLNTTITGATSGNGTTSFTVSSNVTTQATNLKNLINANTTLSAQVIATSSAGVVTITALVPGVLGNGFQISEAMSNTTVSAVFASGSNGTQYTVSLS